MGPFAHLALARELEPLAGAAGAAGRELRQALQAGVLAPDAGYYPGAETGLAQAAHQAGPWALGRRIWELAQGDEERAFALGWASHLLADDIGHREVVDVLAGSTHDVDPLSHKRVEWGLDCWVLARPEHDWLWRVEAASPPGMELWARALAAQYGVAVSPQALGRALAAEMAQVRRLPRVFWRFGLLRRPGHARGNLLAAVNGSTLRLTLLGLLVVTKGSIDARAVLSARPASPEDGRLLLGAMAQARRGLEGLLAGDPWPQDPPQAQDLGRELLRALETRAPA